MKIIRFDSVGGASGDMLLGALAGLGADPQILNRELAAMLPDEDFEIVVKPFESYGINGVQASVDIHEHHHHHHHDDNHHHHHGRSFAEIKELIHACRLSDRVKNQSIQVFAKLAAAEGKIHGKPADEIHFHEVGAVDSIVDIVGCCLAFELLGIDAVSVSALPTGSGLVKCRHGIYPVPAPATAEILTELKSFPCEEEPFEMVTPTGAALLAAWPKAGLSDAQISKTANSFGKHKLKTRPNLLRALLYETAEAGNTEDAPLVLLETNIDDSTPETIGFLCQLLLENGARDVWTSPVMMKKQRLGIMLSLLAEQADKEKLADLVFQNSSTFGIREFPVIRHCLERRFEEVETPYGKVKVKVKIGMRHGQIVSRSPEYDDCARLAREAGVPFKQVYEAAKLQA